MRTSKPPAPEGATGSSRRQPVRQTRVNPPRTSSLNRANPLAAGPAPEQPINILPGVTHFADAITALPKELVRHFTLLKEVDAKIFAPEAALFDLLHDALNAPAPDLPRRLNDAPSSVAPASAATNLRGTANGPANHPAPQSDGSASSVYDPANLPRRTLFRNTMLKIQEMLVSLEEKNHVISTANDALQKQLSRIEDIWPHLEAEFSEEAKWGSATHWAYIENRQAKANDRQAERSRREGAATLSAAAQALAEEAAARSHDRKQAMAAKKNARNQAAEADGDKGQDTGKKAQGAKSRKPLPDSGPVGLGITSGASGTATGNKRRRPEPKASGSTPAERAMGAVYGGNASKQKTTSPRETPAPESGSKKRKALPTSSNQAKKSRTAAAMSPSVTSSPVVGTFPDAGRPARASPAPSVTAPRPTTSRARQNSLHSNADSARQRPPSVAPNKASGDTQDTPDPDQPGSGKTSADPKTQETSVPIMTKPSPLKQDAEEPPPTLEPAANGSKRDGASKAGDEPAASKKDTAALAIQPAPAPAGVVKTKSGRASKPSTPATATFAEAASTNNTTAPSRSRPSRNAESGASASNNNAPAANTTTATTAKRSHKRGASISATAQQAAAAAAAAAAGTGPSSAAASAAEKDKEKDKDAASSSAMGNGSGGRKPQDRSAAAAAAASAAAASDSAARGQGQGQGAGQGQAKGGAGQEGGRRREDGGAGTEKDNVVENDADDDDDDDDDQDPADEDLYCYCNQVSYGEMVACDGEGCPREWFHLGCVGLKVAPKVNAKWYCEDCKKRLKIAERR